MTIAVMEVNAIADPLAEIVDGEPDIDRNYVQAVSERDEQTASARAHRPSCRIHLLEGLRD
ncbi:MAG: hypothetical protein VW891_01375, partial [Novosphingobium sp.]